ncbi:MAG: hypothetical protein DRH33_07045 [Candidatus Nealsonbacteria bacterium]|nr:MAG: hypothetical protein DRH33_07045 [Candidatus Nealsonbacteria bacterium]
MVKINKVFELRVFIPFISPLPFTRKEKYFHYKINKKRLENTLSVIALNHVNKIGINKIETHSISLIYLNIVKTFFNKKELKNKKRCHYDTRFSKHYASLA